MSDKQVRLIEAVQQFFRNKEVLADIKMQQDELKDEIAHLYHEIGESEIPVALVSGGFVVIKAKHTFREVLDKDKLAAITQLSKSEFKTPYDYSKLTQLGKIKPEHVSQSTKHETKSSVQMGKRKKLSKRLMKQLGGSQVE